jgi:hypothetical protein
VSLTAGQASFRDELATRTGLDPRVVTAWLLSEESGAAAASRQRSGNHNWLNIGPGRVYSSPQAGAAATAQLINGSGYYAGIRAAAKSGNAQAQLQAIAASPWDAGHYGGDGRNLRAVFGSASSSATAAGGRPAPSSAPSSSSSRGPWALRALLLLGLLGVGLVLVNAGVDRLFGINVARSTAHAAQAAALAA